MLGGTLICCSNGQNPTRSLFQHLITVIFGCTFLVPSVVESKTLNLNANKFTDNHDINQFYYELDDNDFDNTIATDGCTIPVLRPFQQTEKSLIPHKMPHPCKDTETSLISRNRTHLWIECSRFVLHGIPFNANLSCCYQPFYRKLPTKKTKNIDKSVEYGKCIWFNDEIKGSDEFVRVQCHYKNRLVHDSFNLFAINKPFQVPVKQSGYNVIILGIDNVSRLNFHRTMPKTWAFLRKKGAIEMLGYNKVGDNTFPNIIPMLTGLKDTDLKKTCCKQQNTFDECPFVWKTFQDAGFYTALGEDSGYLGNFNYHKEGFNETPTDYYIRTFVSEAERKVGNNKDFNQYLCMGDTYSYIVLLDYIEHLTTTLRSSTRKLFGFFWETTMTHDFLNYPNVMDDKFEALLNNLDNSSYLDDTVLIMLSDHGIRWGDITYSKQGSLEQRLPMLNILLPSSFPYQYSDAYKNLLLNRRRLTTPFDLYATLNDLTNIRDINNDNILMRERESYNSPSVSLFLPIPFNRTCEMALIDEKWCTCEKAVRRSRNSGEARHISRHVINHLNFQVKELHQCAHLRVHRIQYVRQMFAGEAEQTEYSWQEYQIEIHTLPGNGIYEATLRRKSRHGRPNGDWRVIKINRLNAYINQSQCVSDYHLKQFCYCL